MSILIKDMKMPKKCGECPIVKFDGHSYICRLLGYSHKASVGFSIRMTGCPLVELPEKHGRLIDADALIDEWKSFLDSDSVALMTVENFIEEIKRAATIMGAEGGEEND